MTNFLSEPLPYDSSDVRREADKAARTLAQHTGAPIAYVRKLHRSDVRSQFDIAVKYDGVPSDQWKAWEEGWRKGYGVTRRNPAFLPKSLFDRYIVKSSDGKLTVDRIQTIAGAERKVRELAKKYPCVGFDIKSEKHGGVVKSYAPAMGKAPKVDEDNSKEYARKAKASEKFVLYVDGQEFATYDTEREAREAGKVEGGRVRVKRVAGNPSRLKVLDKSATMYADKSLRGATVRVTRFAPIVRVLQKTGSGSRERWLIETVTLNGEDAFGWIDKSDAIPFDDELHGGRDYERNPIAYAFPSLGKEPLNTPGRVRDAVARFNQVQGATDKERDAAWKRIQSAARKFGIELHEGSWRELRGGGKPMRNPAGRGELSGFHWQGSGDFQRLVTPNGRVAGEFSRNSSGTGLIAEVHSNTPRTKHFKFTSSHDVEVDRVKAREWVEKQIEDGGYELNMRGFGAPLLRRNPDENFETVSYRGYVLMRNYNSWLPMQKTSEGNLKFLNGRDTRGVDGTKADAERLIDELIAGKYPWMIEKPKRGRRKNPGDSADLYESFHGTPSTEEVEFVSEEFERTSFAELGDLVELQVITCHGKQATIKAPNPETASRGDVVKLASDADGRQLYFLGGDQELDLKALGLTAAEVKDNTLIGVLCQVTYRTRKGFHKFKLVEYYHDLGEETGDKPVLLYSPQNKTMSVAGGAYQVRDVGIVN
jgi:hypothetical protein